MVKTGDIDQIVYRHRNEKAIRLTAALVCNGWDSLNLLDAMQEEHWQEVARLAGVGTPSAITREMVRARISERAHGKLAYA